MVEKVNEMESNSAEVTKLADGYYAGYDTPYEVKVAWSRGFEYAQRHLFTALTAENQRLREALSEAKETIKLWYLMGSPEEKEEELWTMYLKSPEMKRLNQALSGDRKEVGNDK